MQTSLLFNLLEVLVKFPLEENLLVLLGQEGSDNIILFLFTI